ncbi:MAG: GIY-YIG nuclease family protein [Halanaerobiaceae bacterium]
MKEIMDDSGVYVLTVKLDRGGEIEVGARGRAFFPAGYYYYCGSAQKNLRARVRRHLRQDKKFHWHIDYLLGKAQVVDFHTWSVGKKGECSLATYFREQPGAAIVMSGFGSCDCRCETHLIYFEERLADDDFPGIEIFG